MNPAVIDPSHMPRIRRTTNRPAKFLHAAWEHKAIAHTVIFKLQRDEKQKSGGETITRTSSIFQRGISVVLNFEDTQIRDNSSKRWCQAWTGDKSNLSPTFSCIPVIPRGREQCLSRVWVERTRSLSISLQLRYPEWQMIRVSFCPCIAPYAYFFNIQTILHLINVRTNRAHTSVALCVYQSSFCAGSFSFGGWLLSIRELTESWLPLQGQSLHRHQARVQLQYRPPFSRPRHDAQPSVSTMKRLSRQILSKNP